MKKKWAFLPFICFILIPFFIRAFSFNSNGYVSRNSIEIFEKFTASRNIRIWLLSSVEKRNSRISVGCTIHPIFGIASCVLVGHSFLISVCDCFRLLLCFVSLLALRLLSMLFYFYDFLYAILYSLSFFLCSFLNITFSFWRQ